MPEVTRQDKLRALASIVLNGFFVLLVGGAILFFVVMVIHGIGSGSGATLGLAIVALLAVIAWKLPKKR
ncbi:hypothetical protein [Amycolatopsis palatopharyngis]|uniref:hypothetical protein n=1 Tax=Amycolatopsis palatopharyngis TaxID=187982 RepID=UPI000E227DD4|nr:hypothetical protein [Amycolatopsis palatopharyngis]